MQGRCDLGGELFGGEAEGGDELLRQGLVSVRVRVRVRVGVRVRARVRVGVRVRVRVSP